MGDGLKLAMQLLVAAGIVWAVFAFIRRRLHVAKKPALVGALVLVGIVIGAAWLKSSADTFSFDDDDANVAIILLGAPAVAAVAADVIARVRRRLDDGSLRAAIADAAHSPAAARARTAFVAFAVTWGIFSLLLAISSLTGSAGDMDPVTGGLLITVVVAAIYVPTRFFAARSRRPERMILGAIAVIGSIAYLLAAAAAHGRPVDWMLAAALFTMFGLPAAAAILLELRQRERIARSRARDAW